MTTKQQIQLYLGLLAFSIWSGMAYFDTSIRGAYLTFVISVVTTLGALILRDMPTQTKE